jgi:hypothetical protein
MGYLLPFIASVFTHWVTLATGGGITAALAVWEHHTGHNVPTKVYWAIMIAFVFWAMFMSWRDERLSLVNVRRSLAVKEQELADERKRSLPDLHGAIDGIGMGNDPTIPDGSAVFLTVSLRNLGAPSIAEDWQFSVEVPGKGTFAGKTMRTGGTFSFSPADGSPPVTYEGSEAIQEKTTQPIITGAMVRGMLLGIVRVPKDDAWVAGTVVRVSCHDVTGKTINLERTMSGDKEKLPFFPGMNPENH